MPETEFTPDTSEVPPIDGVLVYRTGWYYPPYIGSYWIGWPYTYGFGVGFACHWGRGFDFGFGDGFVVGNVVPSPVGTIWVGCLCPGPICCFRISCLHITSGQVAFNFSLGVHLLSPRWANGPLACASDLTHSTAFSTPVSAKDRRFFPNRTGNGFGARVFLVCV